VHRQIGNTSIALGHNGNLTNTKQLAQRLGGSTASTDSDLMLEAIARQVDDGRSDARGLEHALLKALPSFEGAFSLVLMDQGRLVGVRDPHGFRPLSLGRINAATANGGLAWVLSSETAAFDLVGATFVRDIEPGEVVIIDANGVRSFYPFPTVASKLCVFEFVYFARPDSRLFARPVFSARQEMGRVLASEHPVEADVVVPVPESGIPAAQGFSEMSLIPYADGLVKNRYVGRTFIEPSQMLRDRGIRLKLNPIPTTIAGKRVVLVDDPIVRGTTTRQLVQMVRDAGKLAASSWGVRYGLTGSFGGENFLFFVPHPCKEI
jgi:amidophosphoribosyltransferase